jgi:hypothetical protein
MYMITNFHSKIRHSHNTYNDFTYNNFNYNDGTSSIANQLLQVFIYFFTVISTIIF